MIGTGKTMLVKAVANATKAAFIRVVGSEFVQKYLGEVSELLSTFESMTDNTTGSSYGPRRFPIGPRKLPMYHLYR